MYPTPVIGGHRFGFYAKRISHASLTRRCCKEIILQSKSFILNLGVIIIMISKLKNFIQVKYVIKSTFAVEYIT